MGVCTYAHGTACRTLRFCPLPALPKSDLDRMLTALPPEARFEIRLAEFDIAAVLNGTNASLDACGSTLPSEHSP